jgi:hypothetical protein
MYGLAISLATSPGAKTRLWSARLAVQAHHDAINKPGTCYTRMHLDNFQRFTARM